MELFLRGGIMGFGMLVSGLVLPHGALPLSFFNVSSPSLDGSEWGPTARTVEWEPLASQRKAWNSEKPLKVTRLALVHFIMTRWVPFSNATNSHVDVHLTRFNSIQLERLNLTHTHTFSWSRRVFDPRAESLLQYSTTEYYSKVLELMSARGALSVAWLRGTKIQGKWKWHDMLCGKGHLRLKSGRTLVRVLDYASLSHQRQSFIESLPTCLLATRMASPCQSGRYQHCKDPTHGSCFVFILPGDLGSCSQ